MSRLTGITRSKSPGSSCDEDYPAFTAALDEWPVRVDTEYCCDGPQLCCDAYVTRVIVTGTVVVELCRTALHGSSVGELRRRLAEHTGHVRHVQPVRVSLPRAGKI